MCTLQTTYCSLSMRRNSFSKKVIPMTVGTESWISGVREKNTLKSLNWNKDLKLKEAENNPSATKNLESQSHRICFRALKHFFPVQLMLLLYMLFKYKCAVLLYFMYVTERST